MTPPDYSTWLTKAQAAEAIGVSTKTIEAFAQDRRIEQAAWRPQGRGSAKAVYNPDDVARMVQERQPGRSAFVLPAAATAPANGSGHHAPSALAIAGPGTPSGEEVLRLVLAAALQVLTSEKSSTSENSEKLFLTIPEAAAVTGLTQAHLRRVIADKTLPAIRDRGWRIRRRDLEAL